MAKAFHYYVYILTNKNKTVLYTGVTGNITGRLWEHEEGSRLNETSFTARYNCIHLVYFELYSDINTAIAREKQIKGWVRQKKLALINTMNPDWRFLNDDLW